MIVQQVPTNYCAQNWNLVEGYFTVAVKYSDDYTVEQIKTYVLTGVWLLLVIVDESNKIHGALTVSFENGANHRTACITALGGKSIVGPETFNQGCEILKNLGATRIHCYARDSAARLYAKSGLSKKSTLMEYKL